MTVDLAGELSASLVANPTLARLRDSLAADRPPSETMHAACADLLTAMGRDSLVLDTGNLPKSAAVSASSSEPASAAPDAMSDAASAGGFGHPCA